MFIFGIYALVHLILMIRNPEQKAKYTTAQYKVGFTSAVIFIIGPEFFFVPFVSLICKSVFILLDRWLAVKRTFRRFNEC